MASQERGAAIALNGVSLFHVDLNGGGSPVLLLHGNGEEHSSLLPLGRALSACHRVHLLDSRNHGRSDRHPDVSYAAMAGDVVAFIEHLRAHGLSVVPAAGDVVACEAPHGAGSAALASLPQPDVAAQPVAIVGFSDGAIIALLVALQRPDLVSRLALLGPNLSPEDFTPESRQWIEDEWASTGNPLMRLMLTEPNIPLSDLQRIPQPAWVVAGEDDACPRAVFERIAAHLPKGRLSVLAGHNHFSYIFGSAELAPALQAFLSDSGSNAGG